MKHSAVIAAVAGLASASLTVRQMGAAGSQGSTDVCRGADKACDEIEKIEADCTNQHKGNKNDHGACMCKDNTFFDKWAVCRKCLADNDPNFIGNPDDWINCNGEVKNDICGQNPSNFYDLVFASKCPSERFQNQASAGAPGVSAGAGASGAPGGGASQTAAVTTATSSASTATASGADSTASVATGVAPSTGSSPSQGSSGSGADSSNPASTPASTTGSRNSTSPSSRQGSSSTLVNAAASPRAAFASVLAVAAAGAGLFLAL